MSIFLGSLSFDEELEFDNVLEFSKTFEFAECSEFAGCPKFDDVFEFDEELEFDDVSDDRLVGKSLLGLIHSASKPTSLLQKAKKLHSSL